MELKVDIFQFDDYRKYLQAVTEQRRYLKKNFNLAAWARNLSLKSSSTLIMILNGTRNPGDELTELLIKDLKLNVKQADFFRCLVRIEKNKTDLYLRELISSKISKVTGKDQVLLKMSYFHLMSEWYFMAIREMADLSSFQEDPLWIQKQLQFHVPVAEIRKVLHVLEQCGLLTRDFITNKLVYEKEYITTMDVPNPDIRQFHQSAFSVCSQAVEQVATEEREIINMMFTASEKDFPLIKEKIRQFFNELTFEKNHQDDTVYMIQTACIPITKKSKKGSNHE